MSSSTSSYSLLQAFHGKERKMFVTVVVLGVFIGTVLFAHAAFAAKTRDESLKKVFIVFRHGDRTPTETYNNDPYIDYAWPGGWGVLTTKGMRQLYDLGQWIRNEYGWITNNSYSPLSTVVNSSYSDRCIESAQSLLAGLYPPADDSEKFVRDLPWRPIAVHYVPRNMDKTLVVGAPCPKLEQALLEAYLNDSNTNDRRSYFQAIAKLTGSKMQTVTDVEFLYNTLEIEEMNDLKLPEWTRDFYNQEMRSIAALSYSMFTSNTLQRRLRGGPLLKDILWHMKHGSVNQKIFLYSAHDINLVNFLRAMGFLENFKLDLGASLIYELHSTTTLPGKIESHEVRIFMKNNTEAKTDVNRLVVPGCPEPCMIDDLIKAWRDVLPNDWDEECQIIK